MTITKRNIFDMLEFDDDQHAIGRVVGFFIVGLVLVNVIAVILETEPALARASSLFLWIDRISVAIFTAEYIARLWTCTSRKQYGHPLLGRLRYAFTFLALIDLVAILPFYLPLLMPFDLRIIRLFRVMRVIRLAKTSRYFSAFKTMALVVQRKREELMITLLTVFTLLILASSLMYIVERQAQPKQFGSIPAAMWWGVVTLTTVGYGDIYPITPLGKFLGAGIAMLSVGLFALPAGILASGFSEALNNNREHKERKICPHCGRSVDTRPVDKE